MEGRSDKGREVGMRSSSNCILSRHGGGLLRTCMPGHGGEVIAVSEHALRGVIIGSITCIERGGVIA